MECNTITGPDGYDGLSESPIDAASLINITALTARLRPDYTVAAPTEAKSYYQGCSAVVKEHVPSWNTRNERY